jgi:hypothetical protein
LPNQRRRRSDSSADNDHHADHFKYRRKSLQHGDDHCSSFHSQDLHSHAGNDEAPTALFRSFTPPNRVIYRETVTHRCAASKPTIHRKLSVGCARYQANLEGQKILGCPQRC